MSQEAYHIPVLLNESIDGLNIDPNGVYVDATFGGGGHSREILTRLDQGKLFGFDQDEDAQANIPDDTRFTLIPENFQFMRNFLRTKGVSEVDGILADLGVSSHQFNEGERGFSIRNDAPLDMRMDRRRSFSAKDILEQKSEEDLGYVLRNFGEVQQYRRIAKAIKARIKDSSLTTTGELVETLEPFTIRGKENKLYAQVFQAIRICVNEEMEALEELLTQSLSILKPGGRLVVIAYHSLEDRMVKHFIRSGNFKGEVEKDFYGRHLTPFKLVSRKPIIPSPEEQETNNRSRSAKLRIAEKK